MTLPESVTYLAISPEALNRAIREAQAQTEFTDAAGIESLLGIKPSLLDDMVKRGEIKKYKINDHRKPTLFSVAEIRKQIKPIL